MDFLIDGKSLFEMARGPDLDLCGVLDRSRVEFSRVAIARLLLESPALVPGGRQMLFVCPECGDLGCGAITCEVVREGELIVWRQFGFENDYDPTMADFETFASLGPFRFAWAAYRQTLAAAV